MEDKISSLTSNVIGQYKLHRSEHVFTVAISGIDAAGKGHISRLLSDELKGRGYNVALINIDPWQNPIPIRLQKENAAQNIYENIFRWNDFFEQLVFPLKKNKSIYLKTLGIRPDADVYYPLVYNYRNIDILLIEGILLFKQKYFSCFDYRVWIDCSFETGLQRAIERNAEKLEKIRLIQDYHTFYYPAQQYHFKRDDPKGNAHLVFNNNECHASTDT